MSSQRVSFQRDSNGAPPIELQPTGVPADHSDRNHPHFPTDAEAQLLPRPSYATRSCLTKRFLWIMFGSVFALNCLIGAAFLGIKLGTDKAIADNQKSEGRVIYVITTMVSTISMTQVIPTPTISTVTQSLSIIGTDLFPTPTPSKSPCTSYGSWPTLAECKGNCGVPGNMTACGVWSGGFTCVVCPLTQAKASYYLPHN
ncbi:hypothetical protein L13192_10524 [Pyrenophora tritici-repentis]|nr:hypothetical protein L13192_10524 [Pyrenophora tritici-repentis]KAI1677579.1 hypothetical protein KJE20_12515 [Pyrenophora tritici-repentis]